MTTLAELTPGSPAMLTDANRPARRVVVSKVGRKYVYLECPSRVGFDRSTGRASDDWGNVCLMTIEAYEAKRLMTIEAYEAKRASEAARRELRDFGVDVSHRISGPVVLEIREALRTIMTPNIEKNR